MNFAPFKNHKRVRTIIDTLKLSNFLNIKQTTRKAVSLLDSFYGKRRDPRSKISHTILGAQIISTISTNYTDLWLFQRWGMELLNATGKKKHRWQKTWHCWIHYSGEKNLKLLNNVQQTFHLKWKASYNFCFINKFCYSCPCSLNQHSTNAFRSSGNMPPRT